MKRAKFTRSFKSYPFQKEQGDYRSLPKINDELKKRKCGPWFLDAVDRGVFRR